MPALFPPSACASPSRDIDRIQNAAQRALKNHTGTGFRSRRPAIRWCTAVAVASSMLQARSCGSAALPPTSPSGRKRKTGKCCWRAGDHQAKNALAVARAIVRLAKRDSVEEYVKAVEGDWRTGPDSGCSPNAMGRRRYSAAGVGRAGALSHRKPTACRGDRPIVGAGAGQAQLVAMAVHELATNAAKYGSLSVESGVDVTWSTLECSTSMGRVRRPHGRSAGKTWLWRQDHFEPGGHAGHTHFGWHPAGHEFHPGLIPRLSMLPPLALKNPLLAA